MEITPIIFELVALIVAFLRWKTLATNIRSTIVPILILVNIAEWGSFWNLTRINHSNNWIYNIFDPIEFILYARMYYNILHLERKKIQIATVLFLILAIVNLLFVQGIRYFDSYSYLCGNLLMIYLIFLYFGAELRKEVSVDNWSSKITYSPYFWISVGLLFFSVGSFILWSFFEYFLAINNFETFKPAYLLFSMILNIILYSCIIISFFKKV